MEGFLRKQTLLNEIQRSIEAAYGFPEQRGGFRGGNRQKGRPDPGIAGSSVPEGARAGEISRAKRAADHGREPQITGLAG